MKYKRILLKLSGEALMGEKEFGIDAKILEAYANEIKATVALGVQVAIVIGGGNIFRGVQGVQGGVVDRAQKGRVVIFGAGTGNPYFTTDTAASLRAVEIEADVILKGTRVDGVYTADPEKYSDAKKYDVVSFSEVYERSLNIMDLTAITLCQENNLPIVVFDMNKQGNLKRLMEGEKVGTLVS